MIVLKFGGTSVGSADAIRQVKDILAKRTEEINDSFLVVVSAFTGITNQLATILEKTAIGDESYEQILAEIQQRHIGVVRELLQPQKQGEVLAKVKMLFNELEDISASIANLKEVTPKSSDMILSFGERLSSIIIHKYFEQELGGTSLFDPMQIISCDSRMIRGEVDMKASQENAEKLKGQLGKLNLCPGFIAANATGELVTLGRGGSDYTAALFANFYNAKRLEIWTDVDGLMTADPRLVSNARVITDLSYEEALELSHFGAKVIYPPSIQPALEKEIPITIKNTFKPEAAGSKITQTFEDDATIRGISSIKNITLLNLRGSGMVGIPNFSFRLFETLSTHKINVVMITQASSEHTICVGIESKDELLAEEVINRTFKHEISQHTLLPVEVESGLSVLALVGRNMKNQVGVSGQMFGTLGKNGVSIKAIAQGSSERNITVVVSQTDLTKAINVLHESFFTEEIKRVNIFQVGVGTVGKALINQIKKQQQYLLEKHLIDLQVIGIANSKKMYFSGEEGIDLEQWEEKLGQGEKQTIQSFFDRMVELNLRNSVFLDVTASKSVPMLYPEVLKKSISIATPNKIAATDRLEKYQHLKKLERRYKTQFLFETNVCAGLPVISTLSDLIKSGDRVHRIEAVLSGTLNFLFNNYDGSESFSSIVRRAKEEGYSEPDPRLDLSGQDVMRKILILARESGYALEMDRIESKGFVPDACMNAKSVDEFFELVEKEEAHFQKIVSEAKAQDKRIKYVAKYEDGQASTGLQYVDSKHPFYNLEGSDNIVLFYTDRYAEQPLVIKGAGAGAEVTASGIFADIMRVASSN